MQAGAAALLFTDGWQIWQLAVLEAMRGSPRTRSRSPTYAGLVPEIASPARLQQANALRNLAWSVAQIAGPAFAGILVATGGGAFALAVNSATFGVSALCMLAVRTRAAVARERSTVLADLREGWTEFRSRTWLWAIVAQFSVFHLLVMPPIYVLGVVVAKTDYGGAKAWATVLTASGIGSVIGGLVALHVHVRRPLLVATLMTFGQGVLRPRAGHPRAAGRARGGRGDRRVGFAVFGTLWETTLQRLVPRRPAVPGQRVRLVRLGRAAAGRHRDHRAARRTAFGVDTMLWVGLVAVVVPTLMVLCVKDVTRLVHEV